jgi:hypothetical protein
LKFGLFTGITGITWEQLCDLWRHIEDTGWDAACVTDRWWARIIALPQLELSMTVLESRF